MNTDNMKFEKKLVKIDSLVTENLQIRLEMVEDTIEHYAAIYRDDPGKLPPVVVFYDSMLDKYYLADGFHRLAATKRNGCDTILAEIHEGEKDDAKRFAIKANAENGLQRTKADMIHAMELVLENWDTLYANEPRTTKDGLPSREQFTRLCGVTDHMAKRFIEIKRFGESPRPKADKASGGIVVPEICDDAPDALTVTKAHLEERNPAIRALLKEKKDRFGIDIPEKLLEAFRSRVPQDLVRGLNVMYAELEKRRLEGDIVFAPFVGRAMTHLDNLINTIRHGKVYCVCRMCRGEGCGSCNELGFQTHAQYERNPDEFKAQNQ